MTKRLEVESVAQMLACGPERVRAALERLRERGELSAETFSFAGAAWRIAPSDVWKIKLLLGEEFAQNGAVQQPPPGRRRIVRRVRADAASTDGGGNGGRRPPPERE